MTFRYGKELISINPDNDTLISFKRNKSDTLEMFRFYGKTYEYMMLTKENNFYEIDYQRYVYFVNAFTYDYPIGLNERLIKIDTMFIKNNKQLERKYFDGTYSYAKKRRERLIDRIEFNRAGKSIYNKKWVKNFEKLYKEQYPNQ